MGPRALLQRLAIASHAPLNDYFCSKGGKELLLEPDRFGDEDDESEPPLDVVSGGGREGDDVFVAVVLAAVDGADSDGGGGGGGTLNERLESFAPIRAEASAADDE